MDDSVAQRKTNRAPYTRAGKVTVFNPDGTRETHRPYSGSEFQAIVSNRNARKVRRAIQHKNTDN